MTWVRLDDAFGEHPKIASLSDSALALFVTGIAYCNRNLTDGFIPSLVGIGQLRYCGGNPMPSINELEGVGLWESVEGGWRIHDFTDYQPSRAAVQQERIRRQAAGRAGGLATAVARATAEPVAPAQAESKPVPVPVPKEQTPSTPRKRDVLADALARAENSDPSEVPRSRMKTLCVKANELRALDPNCTAEEVLIRASNWPAHFPDATITGPAVVTHWARLANGKGVSGAERELRRAETQRLIEAGRQQ